MNNAPKVETLAQSVAALAGGFDEQRNLINEQIAGLSSQYGAQREALEGTRSQQFNKINEQATGRGMAFSGIPLYEQTQYLANSYLPGLTNLANQENEERMKYRTNIAQLNSQQQQAALSRIDQQQAALNQWNLQQAQLAAQAEQARLDRQFQASQNAADRAANATPQLSPQQAVAQSMASAGTRTNSSGKIVSAANAAETTAAQLSAAGYGSYNDLLKQAFQWRSSTYRER